jgi:transketolase
VYIRICRNEAPALPVRAGSFSPAPVLLRKGRDLSIAASGVTAAAALAAAEILAGAGIDGEVFSVPFIKPPPGEALEDSVRKTGVLVTVEEHNILAGAGSAWLEDLCRRGLKFSWLPLGIEDRFGESGPYEALLESHGLSAAAIAKRVEKFVKESS